MELALAAVVIVIGSYVQSSIGFGLAIISAPLLFIIDPLYVPGPVTVCALTLSLANTETPSHSASASCEIHSSKNPPAIVPGIRPIIAY